MPIGVFSKKEIDAVIDVYPDCGCLTLGCTFLQFQMTREQLGIVKVSGKAAVYRGKRLLFSDSPPHATATIGIKESPPQEPFAVWTKGDSLIRNLMEADESKLIKNSAEYYKKTIGVLQKCAESVKEKEMNIANWKQVAGRAKREHIGVLRTSWMRFETSRGKILETPEPEGEGWKLEEEKEYKRGDLKRIGARFSKTDPVTVTGSDCHIHKFTAMNQRVWWGDFNREIQRDDVFILATRKYSRKVESKVQPLASYSTGLDLLRDNDCPSQSGDPKGRWDTETGRISDPLQYTK